MKTFIHKFTLAKPASVVQAGLQEVFDRSLIEVLFEGRYSLKGSFTDPEKMKFRIIHISGLHEPSSPMLGEIVPDGEGRTCVLLKSKHPRKDVLVGDFMQLMKTL
jgi:hypothetical protein